MQLRYTQFLHSIFKYIFIFTTKLKILKRIDTEGSPGTTSYAIKNVKGGQNSFSKLSIKT